MSFMAGCWHLVDRSTRSEPLPKKEPTPLCKIAQCTGEDVPMQCLFECKHGCHKDIKPIAHPRRPAATSNDFEDCSDGK